MYLPYGKEEGGFFKYRSKLTSSSSEPFEGGGGEGGGWGQDVNLLISGEFSANQSSIVHADVGVDDLNLVYSGRGEGGGGVMLT